MTSLRDNLLQKARTLAMRRGLSLARLGHLCAGDGKFFRGLESGRDITTARYEKADQWLDAQLAELDHGAHDGTKSATASESQSVVSEPGGAAP